MIQHQYFKVVKLDTDKCQSSNVKIYILEDFDENDLFPTYSSSCSNPNNTGVLTTDEANFGTETFTTPTTSVRTSCYVDHSDVPNLNRKTTPIDEYLNSNNSFHQPTHHYSGNNYATCLNNEYNKFEDDHACGNNLLPNEPNPVWIYEDDKKVGHHEHHKSKPHLIRKSFQEIIYDYFKKGKEQFLTVNVFRKVNKPAVSNKNSHFDQNHNRRSRIDRESRSDLKENSDHDTTLFNHLSSSNSGRMKSNSGSGTNNSISINGGYSIKPESNNSHSDPNHSHHGRNHAINPGSGHDQHLHGADNILPDELMSENIHMGNFLTKIGQKCECEVKFIKRDKETTILSTNSIQAVTDSNHPDKIKECEIHIHPTLWKMLNLTESMLGYPSNNYAIITLLRDDQKEILSLDHVDIVVKSVNLDRAEQHKFIRERLMNECVYKNEVIPVLKLVDVSKNRPVNEEMETLSASMNKSCSNRNFNYHKKSVPNKMVKIMAWDSDRQTNKNSKHILKAFKNNTLSSEKLTISKLHICHPSQGVDRFMTSGIVTENTRFCFRSKSVECYLLIQISKEMWSADQHSVLQYERTIEFLKKLFKKWQETTHKIHVILFSRTLIGKIRDPNNDNKIYEKFKNLENFLVKNDSITRDKYFSGYDCFDTFHQISSSEISQEMLSAKHHKSGAEDLIKHISQKILKWPKFIRKSLLEILNQPATATASDLHNSERPGSRPPTANFTSENFDQTNTPLSDFSGPEVLFHQNSNYSEISGTGCTTNTEAETYVTPTATTNFEKIPFVAKLSPAMKGNFLEAMSLSLSEYENKKINSNFETLGHQIICLTPGQGYFEVEDKLSKLVFKQTIDTGTGCDLIMLGMQPLHCVPLFLCYNTQQQTFKYESPYWIWPSFYIERLHTDAHTSNVRHYPRIQIDGFSNLNYQNEILNPEELEDIKKQNLDQFNLVDKRYNIHQQMTAPGMENASNAHKFPGQPQNQQSHQTSYPPAARGPNPAPFPDNFNPNSQNFLTAPFTFHTKSDSLSKTVTNSVQNNTANIPFLPNSYDVYHQYSHPYSTYPDSLPVNFPPNDSYPSNHSHENITNSSKEEREDRHSKKSHIFSYEKEANLNSNAAINNSNPSQNSQNTRPLAGNKTHHLFFALENTGLGNDSKTSKYRRRTKSSNITKLGELNSKHHSIKQKLSNKVISENAIAVDVNNNNVYPSYSEMSNPNKPPHIIHLRNNLSNQGGLSSAASTKDILNQPDNSYLNRPSSFPNQNNNINQNNPNILPNNNIIYNNNNYINSSHHNNSSSSQNNSLDQKDEAFSKNSSQHRDSGKTVDHHLNITLCGLGKNLSSSSNIHSSNPSMINTYHPNYTINNFQKSSPNNNREKSSRIVDRDSSSRNPDKDRATDHHISLAFIGDTGGGSVANNASGKGKAMNRENHDVNYRHTSHKHNKSIEFAGNILQNKNSKRNANTSNSTKNNTKYNTNSVDPRINPYPNINNNNPNSYHDQSSSTDTYYNPAFDTFSHNTSGISYHNYHNSGYSTGQNFFRYDLYDAESDSDESIDEDEDVFRLTKFQAENFKNEGISDEAERHNPNTPNSQLSHQSPEGEISSHHINSHPTQPLYHQSHSPFDPHLQPNHSNNNLHHMHHQLFHNQGRQVLPNRHDFHPHAGPPSQIYSEPVGSTSESDSQFSHHPSFSNNSGRTFSHQYSGSSQLINHASHPSYPTFAGTASSGYSTNFNNSLNQSQGQSCHIPSGDNNYPQPSANPSGPMPLNQEPQNLKNLNKNDNLKFHEAEFSIRPFLKEVNQIDKPDASTARFKHTFPRNTEDISIIPHILEINPYIDQEEYVGIKNSHKANLKLLKILRSIFKEVVSVWYEDLINQEKTRLQYQLQQNKTNNSQNQANLLYHQQPLQPSHHHHNHKYSHHGHSRNDPFYLTHRHSNFGQRSSHPTENPSSFMDSSIYRDRKFSSDSLEKAYFNPIFNPKFFKNVLNKLLSQIPEYMRCDNEWNKFYNIDWQSLIQPALLPLTTNFIDGQQKNVNEDHCQQLFTCKIEYEQQEAEKIFNEVIESRLRIGYQKILDSESVIHESVTTSKTTDMSQSFHHRQVNPRDQAYSNHGYLPDGEYNSNSNHFFNRCNVHEISNSNANNFDPYTRNWLRA